uniref:CARD domain-containing protein n=1 Tax=Chelydra serpentina TaxID=8475 RepID=A0A8C3SSL2_CHESE
LTDRTLSDVRIRFVESVSRAVISTLLDDLLERRVLNEEEVEEVKESCSKKSDQARCLIDGVRKKGARASEIFIERLRVRDVHLATELGLGAPSGDHSNGSANAPDVPCSFQTQALSARGSPRTGQLERPG